MISKYIYPRLPSRYDIGIRISGSGLANCLFVYSRAVVLADKYKLPYINPTWRQFNIGPYLRRESDKRHYLGLFKSSGISGVKKYYLLTQAERFKEADAERFVSDTNSGDKVLVVEGLKDFFTPLIDNHWLVRQAIVSILKNNSILSKEESIAPIGLHIRLGDYVSSLRIDIKWYQDMIILLRKVYGEDYPVSVFSDGTEEELQPLLQMKNVHRAFYGNALNDILALSKSKVIIGSDSTFSGWAAFLGQTPFIYCKKHFGRILKDSSREIFIDNTQPEEFYIQQLKSIR